jgi:hypothetical protein
MILTANRKNVNSHELTIYIMPISAEWFKVLTIHPTVYDTLIYII